MRARLARALLCRAGWHDWTFVVLPSMGHLWIAEHCRRCHWQSIGSPLDHQPRGRSC